MSCGISCRCGSDLALLWLWHRLAAAAPIRPLAWEFTYATGAALRSKKKKKGKRKTNWWLSRGEAKGWGKLEAWDCEIQTTTYKINNCTAQGTIAIIL